MNEQEQEIQQLMEKIQKLQAKGSSPQPSPSDFNPEGQFDNQGGSYATTEGNGMFDNQGPTEKPTYNTPQPPSPQPPSPKPQPAQQVLNTTGVQPGQPPREIKPSNVCEQCGLAHPPIPPGQKCPNASFSKEEKNETGLDDAIINKHLVEMRNIILTNMSKKGIKDGKKYFQNVIVKLTKVLEESDD